MDWALSVVNCMGCWLLLSESVVTLHHSWLFAFLFRMQNLSAWSFGCSLSPQLCWHASHYCFCGSHSWLQTSAVLVGLTSMSRKVPLHFRTVQVLFVQSHLTRYNRGEISVSLSWSALGFRICVCCLCGLEYFHERQMWLKALPTLIIMLINQLYTIHVLLCLYAEMRHEWCVLFNPK